MISETGLRFGKRRSVLDLHGLLNCAISMVVVGLEDAEFDELPRTAT